MAEYIERGALMQFPIRRDHYDRKNGNRHFINGIETVLEYAENLQAADVAPVVHGRWIKKWDLYDKGFYISRKEWYTCSNCGMKTNYKDESFEKEVGYNYCPNCGAKMDGGDGDAAD